MTLSLQEKFAANSACFGCGPANTRGLRLKSFPEGDTVVCEWKPESHHEAFPGMLSGGIVGTLLDCHSNWAAAYYIMKLNQLDAPLCTVTADYHVKLLRPTPSGQTLFLKAKALEVSADRARIEAELHCNGKITAVCTGLFVAVKPGHPAYHRWS